MCSDRMLGTNRCETVFIPLELCALRTVPSRKWQLADKVSRSWTLMGYTKRQADGNVGGRCRYIISSTRLFARFILALVSITKFSSEQNVIRLGFCSAARCLLITSASFCIISLHVSRVYTSHISAPTGVDGTWFSADCRNRRLSPRTRAMHFLRPSLWCL